MAKAVGGCAGSDNEACEDLIAFLAAQEVRRRRRTRAVSTEYGL